MRMSRTAARKTCAHLRVYLALLPSGPDAVRRLKLLGFRAAVRLTRRRTRRVLQHPSLPYGVGLVLAGLPGSAERRPGLKTGGPARGNERSRNAREPR